MTEKELYRKTFDEVAASGMRKLEVCDIMNNVRVHKIPKKTSAVLVAAVLFVVGVVGAYAADIGGFRHTVQLWLYGEQVEITVSGVDGSYQIEDSDGEVIQSGGGIAIEPNGSERPLTEDEIMEELGHAQPMINVVDGKMTLYFEDQIIDISEKFEDGICRIELPDRNGMTLYVTVRDDGALSASNDGFVDP